eukprot:TRINITY_DN130_c0_g3_i1.p1 TRINITY_DN130_c0_g3~~TRINITY_DN130_c0_g3_i1.p1  ORF type:complete len:568 (-),score=93.55 TRINITY_DN130_c0_g3_i1:235-1938(-)
MPLYEEKLICPLAVRFTQDHVRPKFKDGRELEDSIHQIQSKPGADGYDFLLEAPFPTIEIIRWAQFDTESAEADADHWFTLDNRRLYCLQRVAVSLWPKKCAVRVEVLYAACHGIKKKDTSSTVGRSVAIKHSDKHADTLPDHWDWRAAVQVGLETRLRRTLRGIKEEDISGAHEFVACEDKKATTKELLDAPEVPGLLSHTNMACAVSACDASTDADSNAASGNASTDSSPRMTLDKVEDMPSKDFLKQNCDTLSALQLALKGTWTGKHDETYEVMQSNEEASWACVRRNANGSSKKFTLWYDDESNCISWGRDWSYYADASEFLKDPVHFQWYRGFANDKNPAFRWHCASYHADKAILNHSAARQNTFLNEQTKTCMSQASKERTSSTGDASTDAGSASADESASLSRMTTNEEEEDTLSALKLALEGTWTGNRAETYEVVETDEEATWTCRRWNSDGSSKKYTLWYDNDSNCIVWGLDWSYYADASEFLADPASLQWYGASAKERKTVFEWHCAVRRTTKSSANRSAAGQTSSKEQTRTVTKWHPSWEARLTYQPKATKLQYQR